MHEVKKKAGRLRIRFHIGNLARHPFRKKRGQRWGSCLIGGADRGLRGCNYSPNPPKQKALEWGTLKMVSWASPRENGYERAYGWKGQTFNESEMARA